MFPFKNIQFGFASAEVERLDHPDLLLRGFVDPLEVVDRILASPAFLVLGDKGTGKSAIREHLDLLADPARFIVSGDLAGFEFSTVKRAMGADTEDDAWRSVLLLQLVNSVERDTGVRGRSPGAAQDWDDLLDNLAYRGLIWSRTTPPITKFATRVKTALGFGGKGVSFNSEGSQESESSPQAAPLFAQQMEHVLLRLDLTSQHILIIDGLDDVLVSRKATLETLSALIREAHRLNNDLRSNLVSAKVVVLCREDLFEAMADPNMNKIAADRALRLHWTAPGSPLRESALIQLIEHRAKYANNRINLWNYFPEVIEGTWPTMNWLTRLTRETPRDLVMLMRSIQDAVGPADTTVSRDQILAGAKKYSEEFLFPEIRDQLVGFVDRGRVDDYFDLLSTLGKHSLWMRDLELHAKAQSQDVDDCKDVLQAMFRAGAIGNAVRKSHDPREHRTFRFKNRRARFNPHAKIIVHPGLIKALNLAFRRKGTAGPGGTESSGGRGSRRSATTSKANRKTRRKRGSKGPRRRR